MAPARLAPATRVSAGPPPPAPTSTSPACIWSSPMSDEVDEALLDVTVAEPHHLLVLPTDVTLGEVEALALSHFDDAGIHDDATLHITGGARLTGPWRLGSAQRDALDLPSWAATALVLRCPVRRSAPVPPALLGGGGLRDAFPD